MYCKEQRCKARPGARAHRSLTARASRANAQAPVTSPISGKYTILLVFISTPWLRFQL